MKRSPVLKREVSIIITAAAWKEARYLFKQRYVRLADDSCVFRYSRKIRRAVAICNYCDEAFITHGVERRPPWASRSRG